MLGIVGEQLDMVDLAAVRAGDARAFEPFAHGRMILHRRDSRQHLLRKVDSAAAILVERRDRLQLRVEPVLHPDENRREHEVRVRVRTGEPVFDPQVARIRLGNPEQGIAILEAPARAARRVHHRTVKPKRVVIRREHGHAMRQQCEASGHRMPQRPLLVRREQVAPRIVVEAHVHVHPAARRMQVRLAHEARA
ncbi:hypothetical protein C3E98_031375, partial [Pseudomonas sp. MWU13-2625]